MADHNQDLDTLKKNMKPSDGKFSEDEKELVKQIVVHEAYSAAYKIKLASVILAKGAKAAGSLAVKGGKAVQKKLKTMGEARDQKKRLK